MPTLNLSTEDYGNLIAEAYIDGRHKQAVRHWRIAIRNRCAPKSLLEDFAQALDNKNVLDTESVIELCSNILSNIDKE